MADTTPIVKIGFNDKTHSQSLLSFLSPTFGGLIFLFIVSLLMCLLLNYAAIWAVLSSSAEQSTQLANQAIQPQLEIVTTFLNQEIFAKATVFIVWACIGALAYTVVGAFLHFVGRIKDDLDASKYVMPTVATKKYWYSRFAQYVYLVSITFLSIMFAAIFLAALLPQSLDLVRKTILDFSGPLSFGYFFLGVGLMMIWLYVLSRLWRAVTYCFKITFENT